MNTIKPRKQSQSQSRALFSPSSIFPDNPSSFSRALAHPKDFVRRNRSLVFFVLCIIFVALFFFTPSSSSSSHRQHRDNASADSEEMIVVGSHVGGGLSKAEAEDISKAIQRKFRQPDPLSANKNDEQTSPSKGESQDEQQARPTSQQSIEQPSLEHTQGEPSATQYGYPDGQDYTSLTEQLFDGVSKRNQSFSHIDFTSHYYAKCAHLSKDASGGWPVPGFRPHVVHVAYNEDFGLVLPLIAKCGSSVTRTMLTNLLQSHFHSGVQQKKYEQLSDELLGTLFGILIVRNPLDRFTSGFWEVSWRDLEEVKKGSGAIMFDYKKNIQPILVKYMDKIESAVLGQEYLGQHKHGSAFWDVHHKPVTHLLFDRQRQAMIRPHFVVDVRDSQYALAKFAKLKGIPEDVIHSSTRVDPKKVRTRRWNSTWAVRSEHMTPSQVFFVCRIYAIDYCCLGYEFPAVCKDYLEFYCSKYIYP